MFGTAFKLKTEKGKNTLRLLTSGRIIRGIFQNLSYSQATIKIHVTMTECPLDDNDYDYNLNRVLHDQNRFNDALIMQLNTEPNSDVSV